MKPNKEDFLQQVQQHKRIIYKICHAYCKNKDAIEDLAQEMIYQLWKSFGSYQSNYKFSTWMYRIALNTAISFYRSNKKHQYEFSADIHLIQLADTTEDAIINDATINLLQTYISQLKPLDKALMLLYLEENTYRDIAGILGITETNVATKIGRIKEKIKQQFSTT